MPFVSVPVKTIVHDLDSDGEPDLVWGTHAPKNGAQLPDGSRDDVSRLGVVSGRGALKWSAPMGGEYSRALPEVCRIHDRPWIYALVTRFEESSRMSETNSPPFGRVVKMDIDGREAARYEHPQGELCSMLAVEKGPGGEPVVLVGDSHGWMHVLGPDLVLKQKVQVTRRKWNWVWIGLRELADLDGDGRLELVGVSRQIQFLSGSNPGRPEGESNFRLYHDCSIFVLDEQWQPAGRHLVAAQSKTASGQVDALPAQRSGERLLLLRDTKAEVLRFRR
jgi:hypothetical protein